MKTEIESHIISNLLTSNGWSLLEILNLDLAILTWLYQERYVSYIFRPKRFDGYFCSVVAVCYNFMILCLNKVDLSMHMICQLRILKAVLLLFIETYKGNTDHLNRSPYKGHTRTIFPLLYITLSLGSLHTLNIVLK